MVELINSIDGNTYFKYGEYEYEMWFFNQHAYVIVNSREEAAKKFSNILCPFVGFVGKIRCLPFIKTVDQKPIGLIISFIYDNGNYKAYLKLKEAIENWNDDGTIPTEDFFLT